MRTIAVDWAIKKDMVAWDGSVVEKFWPSQEKVDKFLAALGKEKVRLVFEAGGGDYMKVAASRAGHAVFQVAGKHIKGYREARGLAKTDENDAKLIYDSYNEWAEGTKTGSSLQTIGKSSPRPIFLPFTEQDADLSGLRLLVRDLEGAIKKSTSCQNQIEAFKRRYQLCNVPKTDLVTKVKLTEARIALYKKEAALASRQIGKFLKRFPIWTEKWQKVKGFGPRIAGGLIVELSRCQAETIPQFRHYCGFIRQKEYNKAKRAGKFKNLFYLAVESVMKQDTPVWRELYDSLKEKYVTMHPDWSKWKIDRWAKKELKLKIALEFLCDLMDYGMIPMAEKIRKYSPSQAIIRTLPRPKPKTKRAKGTSIRPSPQTEHAASPRPNSIQREATL